MNIINYQTIMEQTIAELPKKDRKEKLLLHACCAPCASYVLEYLTQYFEITVFFCNPNITDRKEYDKRLGELYRLCELAPFCSDVQIVDDGYAPERFDEVVSGFERELEGGKRCRICFDLRLSRTADYAKKWGFSLFATTLTVSPHKNASLINEIALRKAEISGVSYLPSDFKKKGGYQRSIVLSKEYQLYRQLYCGCAFSHSGGQQNQKEQMV